MVICFIHSANDVREGEGSRGSGASFVTSAFGGRNQENQLYSDLKAAFSYLRHCPKENKMEGGGKNPMESEGLGFNNQMQHVLSSGGLYLLVLRQGFTEQP